MKVLTHDLHFAYPEPHQGFGLLERLIVEFGIVRSNSQSVGLSDTYVPGPTSPVSAFIRTYRNFSPQLPDWRQPAHEKQCTL